jgi:hypothetical protein
MLKFQCERAISVWLLQAARLFQSRAHVERWKYVLRGLSDVQIVSFAGIGGSARIKCLVFGIFRKNLG